MKSNAREIMLLISDLKNTGAMMIRTFHSHAGLASAIQAGLDNGRIVVFMPNPRHMREFFNERGFEVTMSKVLGQLRGHEILIEPGFYGNNLAVAV